MARLNPSTNPFALMMDPEAVFQALQSSDRLARLKSRICRPLDQPLIAKTTTEVADFDHAIEADPTVEPEATFELEKPALDPVEDDAEG